MLGLLSTKFELIQKSLILLDLVTVYNGKYRKVFFSSSRFRVTFPLTSCLVEWSVHKCRNENQLYSKYMVFALK